MNTKTVLDTDITPKMAQRSPKKKLEKDIQREICDWLHSENYFFWRQNNIPVFQRDTRGSRFRAMPKYALRGLPDIMCLCNGRFIGLEVKVPDYWKFTDDQKAVQEKIEANGGAYNLVTSLEQVQAIMATLKV